VVLHENQFELIEWAETNSDYIFRGDSKALGWAKGGEIVAVAIMDSWSENDCCIHIVSNNSPGWCNKVFLRTVFTWLFIDLGLKRVTGIVPSVNVKALKFNLKLGFTKEGTLREADANGDIIITGMLKSECRWLPKFKEGTQNG